MRQSFKVFALCVTLTLVSGATCRKSGETVEADAQSKNTEPAAERRGDATAVSEERPADDPFARIPRVSVKELKKALDEGHAVVADVRPAEAFEDEHIAGAFSVPEDDWAARASDLPKDKLVVTYCA